MSTSEEIELQLEPADVPEWEDEDEVRGVLGPAEAAADPEQIRTLLDGVRLTLPGDIASRDLVAYAQSRGTPLGEELTPDLDRFDYHLAEVPLNVVLPTNRKLVRVRLKLQLDTSGDGPVVAYDVFPPDEWAVHDVDIGRVGVDVSKLLEFVFPAPVADALELKLAFPLRWSTRSVRVDASGRMSNPAEWYVTDAQIANGLTAYLIVRGPKGADVTMQATLLAELRHRGPLGILKGRFKTRHDHAYEIS